MEKTWTVVKSSELSTVWNERFVVINKETGKVLDDAQGYGYKTIKKAYAAYTYKTRDKSKDKAKVEKAKKIKAWMKEHKGFVKDMETYAFEIAKGAWGPEDKFDAKFVKKMLKDNELEVDFTPGELLRVWQKNIL